MFDDIKFLCIGEYTFHCPNNPSPLNTPPAAPLIFNAKPKNLFIHPPKSLKMSIAFIFIVLH